MVNKKNIHLLENFEKIGNIKKLEFKPWGYNIKKKNKCSITIKEKNNF